MARTTALAPRHEQQCTHAELSSSIRLESTFDAGGSGECSLEGISPQIMRHLSHYVNPSSMDSQASQEVHVLHKRHSRQRRSGGVSA